MDRGGRLKGLVPFNVVDNAVENAFDAHVAMWRMLFQDAKMWFTVPGPNTMTWRATLRRWQGETGICPIRIPPQTFLFGPVRAVAD